MTLSPHRDTIAQFVYGYLSEYWFGIAPPRWDLTSEELGNSALSARSYKLSRRIEAMATSNGLVTFSLLNCPDVAMVIHRESLRDLPENQNDEQQRKVEQRLDRTGKAQEDNAEYARILIVSHQACVEAVSTYTHSAIENSRVIYRSHDLGVVGWRRSDAKKKAPVIPWNRVDESFRILDQVLSFELGDLPLLVDMFMIAKARLRERRFYECLTICWTVCEKIVNYMWDHLIRRRRELVGSEAYPKSRIQMLKSGRDYTASIRLEILEMQGNLTYEVYKQLTALRKGRNDWLHGLKKVTAEDATTAVNAVRDLFRLACSIDLQRAAPPGGGRGGMFTDVFARRHPDVVLKRVYDG